MTCCFVISLVNSHLCPKISNHLQICPVEKVTIFNYTIIVFSKVLYLVSVQRFLPYSISCNIKIGWISLLSHAKFWFKVCGSLSTRLTVFPACKLMQGMIYSKILPVITVTIDQLCAPTVMIIGLGFIDTSFWSLISPFIFLHLKP